MRVVVHDYSGHPGQASLSRELAALGHRVQHQYCASYPTGRGNVERQPGDPDGFSVRPITLTREFARYSPAIRVAQEVQYAAAATRVVLAARPHVVVLSNVPLLSLLLLTRVLRVRRVPYVFWQQDVYSAAIGQVARRRLGRAGRVVGWTAERAEALVARGARAVVPISETFTERLAAWRVPPERVHVVPNWAPIEEMPQRPRDNAWARAHGLVGVDVLLYAGTLGLKHDPSLLADLAEGLPAGTRLVVVSEGIGRAWLEAAKRERGLDGLLLLDYQRYDDLPDVLASADVLLAVLESDASRYSVPSKVLNYLCAGRPVLGVVPEDNAVAQSLRASGAGVVVPPGERAAALAEATALLADPGRREALGRAGREHAERTFDVSVAGSHFCRLLAR